MREAQLAKIKAGKGFIAALDQSGGSTPKALKLYGISEDQYKSEDEMFNLVHQMRSRIITSPVFTGERILGVILFEMTMNRLIQGIGAAEYLWQRKHIVPFVKVDLGLESEAQGVQLMKPIPALDDLLDRAINHGVFGTKMRSVIKLANSEGISKVVSQQFELGKRIMEGGLTPIIEPEVDIKSPEKVACEIALKQELKTQLDNLSGTQNVMLKLTLPSQIDFYSDLVEHPRVLRIVALSGGYTRADANHLLGMNQGIVASFSRALTEGLSVQQSDSEFDATLDEAIASIYFASVDK